MTKKSSNPLVHRLAAKGATVTEARKAVCRVLEKATDHPDAFQIHERARKHEARISVASVYRILSLLEKHDLVEKHDFKDKRTRFEFKRASPHDQLIDLKSGAVIEFTDPELEDLKAKIAARLGYSLEAHSLELYGHPI